MREDAIQDLARSGISEKDADIAGIFSADSAKSEIYEEMHDAPALALPYHDPWTGDLIEFERDGEVWEFARVRYLDPPRRKQGFKKSKPQRYGQPKGSGVHPYFPIVEGWDWLDVIGDSRQEIVITEGEKKALAGCLSGFATLGLGGVSNFLERADLIPMLDRIDWKKRPVYICFDSDAAGNPDIITAEARLAHELGTKRGAEVHLVRIPDARDGSKQGIDDLVVSKGVEAFEKVLDAAEPMSKLDAAVLALNEHVAWVEADGMVYDFMRQAYMRKGDFVDGSQYSAIKVLVPPGKGKEPKRVSVAKRWLQHPSALRYADIQFKPDHDATTVPSDGALPILNSWQGFDAEPGNVAPFIALTEHLCSTLEPDQQDFLLKLMAYKFQNPGQKVPIAPIFTGTHGTGKSLWAKTVRRACGKYGRDVSSAALKSDFNGYVEGSLICVIDEAKGIHLSQARNVLKNLISEGSAYLNEKYRVARQVETYSMYILTSNEASAASFEHDDRRMFVVDVQSKKPKSFYLDYLSWLNAGGERHVAHFLTTYDLEGWTPPASAPMTHEKRAAYLESLTPVQRLGMQMKEAQENTVLTWLDAAIAWCEQMELGSNSMAAQQAADTRTALMAMPVRPFYAADELFAMFPHMNATLSPGRTNRGLVESPGELSQALRESGGAKLLRCKDSPMGFLYKGFHTPFLIIAEHDEWEHTLLSQNEFNRLIRNAPRYADIRRHRG